MEIPTSQDGALAPPQTGPSQNVPEAPAPTPAPSPPRPTPGPTPASAEPAAPAITDGRSFIERAKAAGHTDADINAYLAPKMVRALELGYTQEQINEYWGIKPQSDSGGALPPRAFRDRIGKDIWTDPKDDPNVLIQLGIAKPDSPVGRLGVLGAIADIPRSVADWYLRTPSVLEQIETADKARQQQREDYKAGVGPKPNPANDPGREVAQSLALGFAGGALADAVKFKKLTTAPDGAVTDVTIGGLPTATDFDNAAGIAATGADTTSIKRKLDDLWHEKGVHPAEVPHDAARDVTIGQDLVAVNRTIPEAYGGDGAPTEGGSRQESVVSRGETGTDENPSAAPDTENPAGSEAAPTSEPAQRVGSGGPGETAGTTSAADADLGTAGPSAARRLVADLDAGHLKPSVEQVANRYSLSKEEAANLLDEVSHRPDTPIELASRTVEDPANPKHRLTTEDLAKFRWRKVSPDVRERRLREHDEYAQNVHGIARSDFASDADFVDALQDHMVAAEMVRLRPIIDQARAAGEEVSLVEARDIEHATQNGASFEDALSDAKERASLRAEPRIVGGPKPEAAPDIPFTPRGQVTVAQRRPLPIPGSVQDTIDAALRSRGRLVAGGGGGTGGPGLPVPAGAGGASPQEIILSKISVGEHDAGRPMSWSRFYTLAIDDLNPIKKAIEAVIGRAAYRDLPVSENAYPLFRLSRGTYGKADEMLERGTFDFKTYQTNGRGLREILRPVRYDVNGLRAYAASRRALELEARGINSGLDPVAAADVVGQGAGHYEAIFRELVGYQNRLTEYLHDAGLISPDAFAAMRAANAEYVPFFRVMDETLSPGEGTGKGLNSRNPVKKIEGSERVIIDPIESIIKNTYAYIALAEKNAAGLKLVDGLFPGRKVRLLENTTVHEAATEADLQRLPAPGEAIIERIDEPTQHPVPANITEFLTQHGLDKNLGPDLFAMVRTAGADEGHIIRVLRDGKPETYKVSEDLATAWRGLDQESTAFWVRLMAAPTRMLKAGVTLDPSFAARNVIRDFFGAAVNTTGAVFHPVNTLQGLMSVAKQDKFYRNWLKGGGANSALVSMDRRYLQESVFNLNEETGLTERFWNSTVQTMREGEILTEGGPLRGPLAPLRALSELIENATRVGEARKIMEAQAKETGAAVTKEQIQEAAFRSREVTLDFARIGAKTRAVNQLIAFFNPTVQSVDRLVREAYAHPLGFTAKATAWITTPSVLLWWANQHDPRWDEIPRWQKDLAWIVMTDRWTDQGAAAGPDGQVDAYHRIHDGRLQRNEGTIWRFPKPFELGLFFGSLPERILESYIAHNPSAWKDIDRSLTSMLIPSVVPTVGIPMAEQFANRSIFTGAPIVPGYAEKLLPEYQYSPYTSETAKILGQLVGAFPGLRDKSLEENSGIAGVARSLSTPALIDNYIRAWTGGLGQYALGIADAGLRRAGVAPDNKPSPALADIPFIKAFVVRYPSAAAQSIADFYEGFAAQERVVATYMERIKAGDIAGAGRIADWAPAGMIKLDGFQRTLGEHAAMVRMVADNPEIPAGEKRQLIDSYYFRMIEIARAGNEVLGAMKAAVAEDRHPAAQAKTIEGPAWGEGHGMTKLTPEQANSAPAAVFR